MINELLFNKIITAEKINTHSHFKPKSVSEEISLRFLIERSYLSWHRLPLLSTQEERSFYILNEGSRSYFVYLMRAIQDIYKINDPLTAENWELYDSIIRREGNVPGMQESILKKCCRYKTSLLDAYWLPGSDNQKRQLYTPVFRIDPYLFAYDKNITNHDHHNTWTLHNKVFACLHEYIEFFKDLIRNQIASGCVALKCAVAYDRPLIVDNPTFDEASKVFDNKNYTEKDVKAFQDYMINQACRLAAQLDVPLQWHTGLGCLKDTRALEPLSLIQRHPATNFVLFHGSYPWTGDIPALLHNYRNVYADICWMPLLSPTKAKSTLHELIEIAPADHILWGCDTSTPEESYGACIALAEILSEVLHEKIISGYLDFTRSDLLIHQILMGNALKLYRLSDFT